jgi:hypothetical protein
MFLKETEPETRMLSKKFGILLGAVLTVSPSQSLDLRGRVLQGANLPVNGATVELKQSGASVKTAADGAFVFDAGASISPGGKRAFGYRLHSGFLSIDVGAPVELRIRVFDAAGGAQGGLVRRLAAGSHRIHLAEAMTSSEQRPGLHFLGLRIGNQAFTHFFLLSGKGASGMVFAPENRRERRDPAWKRSATVDSLRIRKVGFRDLVTPITSYTAGDLGDFTLSAEEVGYCPGQRLDRTSDGFDVWHCDALFEHAPRVHLPDPNPLFAFAMRTADSLVTVTGKSYPLANLGASDPEIRRHGSALYEIKIMNGKLESYRPAIVFAESLFLAPIQGKSFEGLIAQRTAAGRYDLNPTLPVRVQVSSGRFQGGTGGPSGFRVKAAISNLANPVAAADGTCMPSLASHGSKAPFDAGTEVYLLVERFPSMHTFGDDELVIEYMVGGASAGNLMSRTWFYTPLDLVQDSLALSGTYEGIGHGAPGAIPWLSLKPVSGGGGACTP